VYRKVKIGLSQLADVQLSQEVFRRNVYDEFDFDSDDVAQLERVVYVNERRLALRKS
jgi:hypothetical protein